MSEIRFFFLILVPIFSCFITSGDNRIVLAVLCASGKGACSSERHSCNEAIKVFFSPLLGTTIAIASHFSYF